MSGSRVHAKTWIVVTAISLLAAAGCGTGSLDKAGNPVPRPVILTLADGDTNFTAAQVFADAVHEQSHGALKIRIEDSWRPNDRYYQSDLIKDVRAGKAQLGMTVSWAFDTVGIGNFRALQAPFLIDSYPLEQEVLSSDIPAKMLAGLQHSGLVGLGVVPGSLQRPVSYSAPLLGASSYQGASIGISPSDISASLFRALGAHPVVPEHFHAGDLVGDLGGIEADVTGIGAGAYLPGASLTADVVFGPRPQVLFMNRHTFEGLTAGQRRELARAAAAADRDSGVWQRSDAAAMRDLCHRQITVVTASQADLAGLLAAARPVYQRLESDPQTEAFISQIRSMRTAIGDAPQSVECPPAGAAGSSGANGPSPTLLEGTWQATYTEADLIAAGGQPGSLDPGEGNWGSVTLTLNNGQWLWRLTGGDPGVMPNNLVDSGTYVVTGGEINFYRHDHDYQTSDTEVWGPFIWSAYRGTLTFKRAGWTGDSMGPTALVVKPWQQTGA
jgi:TRAP-type C4-dicarboxylate transport system substrate-binding protein